MTATAALQRNCSGRRTRPAATVSTATPPLGGSAVIAVQPGAPKTPDARYRVVLADPPWRYYQAANWRLRRKGIDVPNNHYATLTPAEIAALPVGDLAADNAALFLWATMPLLREGIEVVGAWGFRYVTVAFTWAKVNATGTPYKGLGQYTRANTELCLLGIRGRMARKDRSVDQLVVSRRREHSRKPDEQYSRIERLFTGPYVELFARQQWPGWDAAFSNEAEKFYAQLPMFGEMGA